MSTEWIIKPPHERCAYYANVWRVPPLIAQLLLNRGVATDDGVRSFIRPQLGQLHPPESLPGAASAAELICETIGEGGKIVLYGDYDVDGITGTSLLWQMLVTAGANVTFYVPHRVNEGYGLNHEAVEKLARDGANLLVTIDCGITAVEVVAHARSLGLKVIVTDHHQPKEELPDANAIVHPLVEHGYPNEYICGAGVAFKLSWAVAQVLSKARQVEPQYREVLMATLPLAALGTIADVVPLVGENRVLARCGLAQVRNTPLPGLKALLDVAGLLGEDVDGSDVGFRLAPRLNAAGRMGHARLAIELFTRADENRAQEIATYLDEHNRARQTLERKIVRQAKELIERAGLDTDAHRAIVLASDGWHPGVVGIVAARLVDKYHKPAALIAIGDDGVGQASARSVPGFALHEALAACDEHLVSHGGHAMAAGFRIHADNVPTFTAAFGQQAANSLSGSSLRRRVEIDGLARFNELDHRTVQAVKNLGPFGAGNPRPVLATDWLELAEEPRLVGRNSDHLVMTLADKGLVLRGIAFGAAESFEPLKDHRCCRVAFEPVINDFNGQSRVEMQILDIRFPD